MGPDEPLGQANDAELEAARMAQVRCRAERHLDAAAADVDDDGGAASHVDALDGREMDEPGFLGAGDDPHLDARAVGYLGHASTAVVRFADGVRTGGHK